MAACLLGTSLARPNAGIQRLLHFLVVGGLVALVLWLAVPPALHQIGHALGNGPTAGTRGSGRRSGSRLW